MNRTFVTPLDREDIYNLARTLDDVMDAVDAAAGTIRVYRIQRTCARRRASSPASSRAAPTSWSRPWGGSKSEPG